jgi:hypothetical protein
VAAKDGGEEWVVVSNAGEEWARRMAVKMVVVETGGRDGGNEAVRSGQACAAVGLRAAVGVRWAVGVSNTDEVDKLNDQDDTACYRNWADGVGMASWGGASSRRDTRNQGSGDET